MTVAEIVQEGAIDLARLLPPILPPSFRRFFDDVALLVLAFSQ
jgi:hypothetical protein